MKIDIKNMEEVPFEHFKGGEGRLLGKMYFDGTNRILFARLEPGCSIGLHEHDTSCEAIFVTAGCGTEIYDGVKEEVKVGDVCYCPKGHSHTLINTGDEILEFHAFIPAQ